LYYNFVPPGLYRIASRSSAFDLKGMRGIVGPGTLDFSDSDFGTGKDKSIFNWRSS
jgi:hypothetical protein